MINHPDNIAFDPTAAGPADLYGINGPLCMFGTFEAITNVSVVDLGGEAGASA